MSHEIYKSIKQLEDGTFDTVCADSNVFDAYTNTLCFSPFKMTYFQQFAGATNKQKRVAFLMAGLYCGDVFYPSNWKKDKELLYSYLTEKSLPVSDAYGIILKFDKGAKDFCDNFLAYKNESQTKKKKFILEHKSYDYIKKCTSTKMFFTHFKDEAKVFNDIPEHVIMKLGKLSDFNVIYI